MSSNTGHPRPRCLFGRAHLYAEFVYQPGRFCCSACGVEDREDWWGADGTEYVGPAEPVVNPRQDGWLLAERGH